MTDISRAVVSMYEFIHDPSNLGIDLKQKSTFTKGSLLTVHMNTHSHVQQCLHSDSEN